MLSVCEPLAMHLLCYASCGCSNMTVHMCALSENSLIAYMIYDKNQTRVSCLLHPLAQGKSVRLEIEKSLI